jgi:hypothetical protein
MRNKRKGRRNNTKIMKGIRRITVNKQKKTHVIHGSTAPC